MKTLSSIKRRVVRKQEIIELLDQGGWIPAAALKHLNLVTPLKHSDGRLLILKSDQSHGMLYESIEEYLSIVSLMWPDLSTAAASPIHILAGRLPYSEDFPAHIDEMVRALAQTLNLPLDGFDYTSASLGKLDPKLKRRGREACLNSPVIFGGLVAYTMEIARRRKGWRWVMYKHPQHDVWEPWLSDDQGWHFNSWSVLYDIFAETEYGLSVSGMDNEGIMQRRRAPSE